MKAVKTFITYILLFSIFILTAAGAKAQSRAQYLEKVSALVEKEGNLFIAVDQPKPDAAGICLEENEISNRLRFKNDSMFVDYTNYTELFCEAYVLKSHYQYQLNLKDIDPLTMRLVEKKYNYGKGKLKEGPAGWFEVQLFTKQKSPQVKKKDLESRDIEFLPTVSLLFQTKESARSALALLKSAVGENINH